MYTHKLKKKEKRKTQTPFNHITGRDLILKLDWDAKMAQDVNMAAIKLDNPSVRPRIHTVERINSLKLFSDLHGQADHNNHHPM